MSDFSIGELVIPSTPHGPSWPDFVAVAALRNLVEAEGFGTNALNYSAAELLPGWLNPKYDPKRMFVARVEGTVVARATSETLLDANDDHAWLGVQVLPAWRRCGIGMLLKTANLEYLAQESPGHPSVTTFNAEENRHMLVVNEALGFVPMGYAGAWNRVVPAEK